MDNIQKFLKKLSKKQQDILLAIFVDIIANRLDNYDIKKLTGYSSTYRIRKGQVRIIFVKTTQGNQILNIDFRGQAYKDI